MKLQAACSEDPIPQLEEFPLAQKFFAVGETVAHLDYLRLRGKVVRETVKGKNRYRAV